MRFELTIETGNAALVEDGREEELVRLIDDVRYSVAGGASAGFCRDYNGNRVGDWEVNWSDPTVG